MTAQDGFTPWPQDLADRYRAAGWWRGDTLGGLLHAWADRSGDDVAIVDGDARLSYRDLDRAADRLAAALAAQGIGAGDRVLVQLPNGSAFVVLLFALCRIGAPRPTRCSAPAPTWTWPASSPTCAAARSAFKLPERLELVPDLPLTSVGKVDKAALRADVAARLDKETQPS